MKNVKAWADKLVEKEQSRTLHFYTPKQDKNSETINFYLYTPMEVYCEDGCQRTDDDTAVYTFYRSTHYWSLNRVFNDHLICENENVQIVRNTLGEEVRSTLDIRTEISEIRLVWDNKECAFEGASKVAWGGCISINASPINE